MNRINKRVTAKAWMIQLMCLLLALSAAVLPSLSLAVFAEELPAADAYSLTVQYEDGGTPLADVRFDLFRVGYKGDDGAYHSTGEFARYPVDFGEIANGRGDAVAVSLAAYIQRDGVTPLLSGTTGENGCVTFAPLKAGVYLVIGHTAVYDGYTYRTTPFLAVLPTSDPDSGAVIGDLTVEPKHDKTPIEPQPEDYYTAKKVFKVWDDAGMEAVRPESVTVQLLLGNTVYDTVTLSEKNSWRHTWERLPTYDENGVLNNWTVTEVGVPGYTVTVTQDGAVFLITNHADSTPRDEISVVKRWEDQGENRSGLDTNRLGLDTNRPEQITVHLLKNGEVYDSVILNAEMDWRYTWKNLPKTDENGNSLFWSVTEDAVPGYTAEISGTGNPFTIVNTKQPDQPVQPEHPETTTRTVYKVWQIKDQSGKVIDPADTEPAVVHPKTAVIQLYKNMQLYETVVLDADHAWTHTWSDLPMYDADGSLIVWSVGEVPLAGYTAEITEDGNTFTVTNTITVTNGTEDLPQTGVLWWPVTVLAGLGVLLILAGRYFKTNTV